MGKIARLQEFIDTGDHIYRFPENDCAMWTAKALDVIHLTEYHKNYNVYATYKQMKNLINNNMLEYLKQVFHDKPMIDGKFALVCDPVYFEIDNKQSIGICINSRIMHNSSEGLCYLPISKALKAWRFHL